VIPQPLPRGARSPSGLINRFYLGSPAIAPLQRRGGRHSRESVDEHQSGALRQARVHARSWWRPGHGPAGQRTPIVAGANTVHLRATACVCVQQR